MSSAADGIRTAEPPPPLSPHPAAKRPTSASMSERRVVMAASIGKPRYRDVVADGLEGEIVGQRDLRQRGFSRTGKGSREQQRACPPRARLRTRLTVCGYVGC